jgi:hypothetical protein
MRIQLSSEPARPERALIAILWFEKSSADLSSSEAGEVDAIEQRLSGDKLSSESPAEETTVVP